MKSNPDYKKLAYALLLSACASLPLAGQSTTPPAAAGSTTEDEEEVITLSPFEVNTEGNEGYMAADTLAGNRLNTQLRDIGNAVSVITSQFLQDTGAVNNETLLQYTTSTEVGNIYGNFAGVGDGARLDESSKFTSPNQNTRVRGLTEADNSRNYFLSSIPWDGYNVDRVDLQRGPNSILFGQGAPAGLINTGTKEARFKNSAQLETRIASFGSYRASLDLNRVLLEDQLAIRLNLLYDDEKFQQTPAFERDRRAYVAGRWEPAFLKKGSARTIIKANFEKGGIRSNRPRSLPPMDRITPWFRSGTYEGDYVFNEDTGTYSPTRTFNYPNRGTYTPYQLQDDSGHENSGQQRSTWSGSRFNPYYQPWFGNFGQSFGGPLAFFGTPGAPPSYWLAETRSVRGIGTDGQIDGNISIPFNRLGGITGYSGFALNANLPFSDFGVYKDLHITDPSIFNFYDNLIDGPNKKEWQNFESYQLSLAQLFFNDNVGFDIAYNNEDYDNGQLSLLSGDRQGIFIDFMSVYPDGLPAGLPGGLPFSDGTPNPNVGRPFLTDSGQFGNNSGFTNNENIRGTFFLKHDFENGDRRNVFTRILGRHTWTALLAKDEQESGGRSWQRYAVLDPAYRAFIGATSADDRFTSNLFAANPVVYLGPSLLNSSTPVGAHIPRPMTPYVQTTGTIRAYDSTWGHPLNPTAPGYVDPAAPWTNNFAIPTEENPDAQNSSQSENPANYVGWVNIPLNITDSEVSEANRDLLTTNFNRQEKEVKSQALVWQAHFWDNAIVGTYGVRKDTVNGRIGSLNTNSPSSSSFGHIDFDSFDYDTPDPEISKTSRAYTVVAHLTQFPGIGRLMERLPVDVTLFYNRSTNFQPLANRVDVYGEPIPLPQGITRDKGILIETKDRRYSLKVNKFTTDVTNGRSSGLNGTWFLGSSQAWFGNWANRWEFNWFSDTIDGLREYQDWELGTVNYNPAPKPGGGTETAEEAAIREQQAIAGWRAYQATVDPRFYEAWNINLNDPTRAITSNNPNGFALSEDSRSRGYEIEFSAQPTKNWRVTMNASRITATRENIGGVNLADFINNYETALRQTDANGDIRGAGDVRIWWGDSSSPTALTEWNNVVGSEWAQRGLQEGTSVPELRKWRFNAVTTYNFDAGRLKGVYVGGGVRWQDKIVTGYPLIAGASQVEASFDIDNPYYGPTETNFDFWVGYSRRIADRFEWQVQFNLRNAFQSDDLIPITVQPDGSPAGYRLAPAQTFSLTNTFKF